MIHSRDAPISFHHTPLIGIIGNLFLGPVSEPVDVRSGYVRSGMNSHMTMTPIPGRISNQITPWLPKLNASFMGP